MAWLNTSWTYRKKITLTGQTGAGTSYQVPLMVGESSGATGEDFDLGENSDNFPAAKNDGGDFRFTASDGTTELDFWVEYTSGTTPNIVTQVWVEVAADLGSNQDIYIYYGNAGASDSSNGGNTFQLFDDFNDASIDGTIWDTVCSSGCDATDGNSSTITESSDALHQLDAAVGGSASKITSDGTFTVNVAARRRMRRIDSGTFGNHYFGFDNDNTSKDFSSPATYINWNNNHNDVDLEGTDATKAQVYGSDLTQNAWYIQEIEKYLPASNSKAVGTLWSDVYASVLGTANHTTASTDWGTLKFSMRSGDGADTDTDWVMVRKCIDGTEPDYSSVGAEETDPSATPISNLTTLKVG